jgi:Cellulose-binding Sde182, nucleoside hydrolase-like domain
MRSIVNPAVLVFFIMQLLSTLAFAEKIRVLISSDIGGSDPDDFQSLVHFLTYADLFEIEGLISSPPGKGRKSHIEEVLTAYRADYSNLKTYGDYPTYDALMAVTVQGAINPGAPAAVRVTRAPISLSPPPVKTMRGRCGFSCGDR